MGLERWFMIGGIFRVVWFRVSRAIGSDLWCSLVLIPTLL